ncbi:MAG: MFS transporter [Nitrospirota bacterium]
MSSNGEVSKETALVISALASFLTPFMGSSVNIALPSIGREFQLSAISLSWITASFILSASVFLIPIGKIADIYGRKKIFVIGVIFLTLSSLLIAISTSASQLIFFRVLQGIGGAMIFGTAIAILTSVFPAGERGRALGINVASVYLGLSLGPFMGGLLTHYLGWRSIFLINIPLGLIIIVLTAWKLKGEWAEARGEKFDYTGSIIYGIAITSLVYGLSILPATGGLWLIILGTAGFFSFIRWEMIARNPVFHISLFRNNRVFVLSNIAALINYSATFGANFLLSLYMQYTRGLSPQDAGIILVIQPVVMTLFSPFAGKLSDRIEPRIVASMGMAFTALGLFLFIFLDGGTRIESIVAGLILIGLGFALFSSPNTNAIMGSIERKFYGVASGAVGTVRLIGQMFSMSVVIVTFAVYMGEVEITPEYYQIFLRAEKAAFVIFTALCFLGIFASLTRGKIRR